MPHRRAPALTRRQVAWPAPQASEAPAGAHVWAGGLRVSARSALHARLDVPEVELALQERAHGIEDAGADETENRIAEVERDPGGDEEEAEKAEVVLQVDHWMSLLCRRS